MDDLLGVVDGIESPARQDRQYAGGGGVGFDGVDGESLVGFVRGLDGLDAEDQVTSVGVANVLRNGGVVAHGVNRPSLKWRRGGFAC